MKRKGLAKHKRKRRAKIERQIREGVRQKQIKQKRPPIRKAVKLSDLDHEAVQAVLECVRAIKWTEI